LSSLGNTQLGYFLVGLAVVCGIVAVAFLVVALIARIWERDRISN
jgi:hypothetical protein